MKLFHGVAEQLKKPFSVIVVVKNCFALVASGSNVVILTGYSIRNGRAINTLS
jgi:hypothetical protein